MTTLLASNSNSNDASYVTEETFTGEFPTMIYFVDGNCSLREADVEKD